MHGGEPDSSKLQRSQGGHRSGLLNRSPSNFHRRCHIDVQVGMQKTATLGAAVFELKVAYLRQRAFFIQKRVKNARFRDDEDSKKMIELTKINTLVFK